MTALPTVGPRTRELLGGLIRYGLVGLANAATYYGVYLAVHAHAGYLVAHVVGLGVAMVVSFFLNCRFTFRVRATWTRFLLYPASQVVNIVATTVGVVGLVHLGVDERLAPLVAAALAVPVSFLAARALITRAVGSGGMGSGGMGSGTDRTVAAVPAVAGAGPTPAAAASLLDAVTMPLPQFGAARRLTPLRQVSAGRR